jgi:hypothetical protein
MQTGTDGAGRNGGTPEMHSAAAGSRSPDKMEVA